MRKQRLIPTFVILAAFLAASCGESSVEKEKIADVLTEFVLG